MSYFLLPSADVRLDIERLVLRADTTRTSDCQLPPCWKSVLALGQFRTKPTGTIPSVCFVHYQVINLA